MAHQSSGRASGAELPPPLTSFSFGAEQRQVKCQRSAGAARINWLDQQQQVRRAQISHCALLIDQPGKTRELDDDDDDG